MNLSEFDNLNNKTSSTPGVNLAEFDKALPNHDSTSKIKDPQLHYQAIEYKYLNGRATPDEIKDLKNATFAGDYKPALATFEDTDNKQYKDEEANYRATLDALKQSRPDLAYQYSVGAAPAATKVAPQIAQDNNVVGDILRGGGKATTEIGEEVGKITDNLTPDQVNLARKLRLPADQAMQQNAPISTFIGEQLPYAAIGSGLASTGIKALASPATMGAVQGALAPTYTDNPLERMSNTAIGAIAGKGIDMGLGAISRGASKLTGVGADEITASPQVAQAAQASKYAAANDIPMPPQAAMAPGLAKSALDTVQRFGGNIDVAGNIENAARNLNTALANNAKAAKFDNVDTLYNIANNGGARASEAEELIKSMSDSANLDPVKRAELNAQAALLTRKAFGDELYKRSEDAAQGLNPVAPDNLIKSLSTISSELDKNKADTSGVRGIIQTLSKNLVDDKGNPIPVDYPSLVATIKGIKETIRNAQSNGVIGASDARILSPLQDAAKADLKELSQNSNASEYLDIADNFNKTNIQPFKDAKLSTMIEPQYSTDERNAINYVIKDPERLQQVLPLLGEKGQRELFSNIYNDVLDKSVLQSGNTGSITVDTLEKNLRNNMKTFEAIAPDAESLDMVKGLQYTSSYLKDYAKPAGLKTTAMGIGLGGAGAGSVLAGASTPAVIAAIATGYGAARALKALSNNPTGRDLLIQLGKTVKQTPGFQLLNNKIANLMTILVNSNGPSQYNLQQRNQ